MTLSIVALSAWALIVGPFGLARLDWSALRADDPRQDPPVPADDPSRSEDWCWIHKETEPRGE